MTNGVESEQLNLAEQISAMADGELPKEQWQATLSKMHSDGQSLQKWHTYHVVGEALRGEPVAPSGADLAFLARVQDQLAAEPIRSALSIDQSAGTATVSATPPNQQPAANDDAFRWKAVAAASGIALVLVVAMGSQFGQQGAATVAKANSPAPDVAAVPAVSVARSGEEPVEPQMIRDPALDAMLAAHQQMGGTSALQGPSGFLRNATYSSPNR